MKTVLKIFRHDVHDIFTHLFVLITLLAVAVMPFHYAMDALRECVGGMYGNTYWKCLGSLLIFAAVFFFLGLLLYKPVSKPLELMEKNKKDSEIML
ncbi:MAG: hypothetical protein UHP11_06635 [Anaerovoracaceae bacterium]|nr:hypothetical protein [Anaerovoracaceae bacterium]